MRINFAVIVFTFCSLYFINMPNKCGIVNCKGNYNDANKYSVFKVPKDESERKKWLDVLPPRENFVLDPAKFFLSVRNIGLQNLP